MRIVSQQRNYSFDFDRTIFWTQNDSIFARMRGDRDIRIGQYATEKRAEEVFEDMHRAYAPVGIITTNLTEDQTAAFIGSCNTKVNVVQMDDENTGISTYDNYVYYMPEE